MSSSENRKIRRHHLTMLRKGRGVRKNIGETYKDNRGVEYDYKFIAQLSSLYNFVCGCLKNGFPIAVPKLWYLAWAFYPFFLVRRDLQVRDARVVLNHERIHIQQQRDLHVCVSLPIILLWVVGSATGRFDASWLIPFVPFIPTIFYIMDLVNTWRKLLANDEPNITLFKVRMNTCFEREAVINQNNMDYILHRKFMGVLKYVM